MHFSRALSQAECPICLQLLYEGGDDSNDSNNNNGAGGSQSSSTTTTTPQPTPSAASLYKALNRALEAQHSVVRYSESAVAQTPPAQLLWLLHSDGVGEQLGPEPAKEVDAVVVLPCGHLMHHACAAQSCEVARPACAVCRCPLEGGADALTVFAPQGRAGPPGWKRGRSPSSPAHGDPSGCSSSSDADSDGSAEVRVVGTRQVPQDELYRSRLCARAEEMKRRRETIKARVGDLAESQWALRAELAALAEQSTAAQRRLRVLTGGSQDAAQLRRLREACREAREQYQSVTEQLAQAIRAKAASAAQVEALAEQLARARRTRGEGDA